MEVVDWENSLGGSSDTEAYLQDIKYEDDEELHFTSGFILQFRLDKLILEAITILKEPRGSDRATIALYIEIPIPILLDEYPPLLGWLLVGGDPCGDKWQGVECVFLNITELRLSGTNLGGKLGDSLELSWQRY
ncbi:uncharacterized protein LOC115993746 isoform X2 [Quercus lobata]|uniref:uncharacterized protein LOC115993746 isoform X2 n=1 Tax=Quercus lobata TaxID=97700 RepID=UPI0012493B82|nr:uncharacterized protein LOC115993746 isoform X2 [Quercus lobata]